MEKAGAKALSRWAAVDYAAPCYYELNGQIWREDTYWKNTMLLGSGVAMLIADSPESIKDMLART